MKLKIFHDDDTKISWAVRIVEAGDSYGLNDCLICDGNDELVEFYDTRYELNDLGQFVSRYYAETLLLGNKNGIYLDGGIPSWRVEGRCYRRILNWIGRVAR